MKQGLPFANSCGASRFNTRWPMSILLLSLLCCLNSCSPRISGESSTLPPMLHTSSSSQKYNMQLDFMKHHFSGMLIVRQRADNEIRILATTYFGLTLFDLSFRGDAFTVNSCIEPMKNEKILKLLESDFRQLFVSSNHTRLKEKSATTEKRISGKGFGKSIFSLSQYVDGKPSQAEVRHPWIRLTMQLNCLTEDLFSSLDGKKQSYRSFLRT